MLHHKCGVPDKEMTPDSDEEELKKKKLRHPSPSPLISLPLQVALPEQTEPEDLSMSTGLHSNGSSGGSPLRSPCLKEELDDEELDSAAIFLQRRPYGRT